MNVQSIDCNTATIKELKAAFRNRTPISGITLLATHYGPHIDEIRSCFLLQVTAQGTAQFPGIKDASIGFLGETKLRAGGWIGEEGFFKAMQNGILLLGVGHGPLDEHKNRKDKISCTNLVTKLLDLKKEYDDRSLYGPMTCYVDYEDQHSDNLIKALNDKNPDHRLNKDEADILMLMQHGMLAFNTKQGFEQAGENIEEMVKIIKSVYQFFQNEVQQRKLFLAAGKAFEKEKQNLIPVFIPKRSEKFFILEMKSDVPVISKVAFSKWPEAKKEKLAVLFIHKSNGQFVLMPGRLTEKSVMIEIVKILRRKAVRAQENRRIDFWEIGKEGVIDMVPGIHIAEQTGIISNGSKVDPDAPGLIGSELSVQDVVEAVKIGLNENYLPPRFEKDCNNGICARGKCPLYNYGLQRCHDVRNKAKERGQFGVLKELKTA